MRWPILPTTKEYFEEKFEGEAGNNFVVQSADTYEQLGYRTYFKQPFVCRKTLLWMHVRVIIPKVLVHILMLKFCCRLLMISHTRLNYRKTDITLQIALFIHIQLFSYKHMPSTHIGIRVINVRYFYHEKDPNSIEDISGYGEKWNQDLKVN